MKTNIKHLFLLLLTVLIFAACSKENDNIISQPETQQPTTDGIHFTAYFGVKNSLSTRALSEPTNPDDPNYGTLVASWQKGEEIAILFGGNKYTATVTDVIDGIATVSATLPNGTPNNQAVTFIYPASAANESGIRRDLLNEQDGTLATLSSELDVAKADGKLIVSGNTAEPNGTVRLVNQYAICKFQFQFKDENENSQDITDVKELTITDLSTNKVINVTTPSPQQAVYVAMQPTQNSVSFNLVGWNDGAIYKRTATSDLKAGLFYNPTLLIPRVYNAKATVLTFEAISDCTVSFKSTGPSVVADFQHTATDGDSFSISLSAGQKIQVYGYAESYSKFVPNENEEVNPITGEKGHFEGSSFTIEGGDCYVYGNIMSLVGGTSADQYSTLADICGDYTFYKLFYNNPHLKFHPEKLLVLPATTLTKYCYANMFQGCTGLTKAPALPATTLANYCYANMFQGCTGLTKTPVLFATTLSEGCYFSMFDGCTSLTEAPKLPANILTDYCYAHMFQGCTSLTKAPDLPARNLYTESYGHMFYGCTNLKYIKCMAEVFWDEEGPCTEQWVQGVSSTGTFVKNSRNHYWSTGESGIPSGWTVVDAD